MGHATFLNHKSSKNAWEVADELAQSEFTSSYSNSLDFFKGKQTNIDKEPESFEKNRGILNPGPPYMAEICTKNFKYHNSKTKYHKLN